MRIPPTPLASSEMVFPVRPRSLKMNFGRLANASVPFCDKDATYGCIVENSIDSGPCEKEKVSFGCTMALGGEHLHC